MADRYSPQLFRVPKSFWMALDFSIPSADLTESSCFSSRLSLHVWGIICTQSMQTKRGSYEEPVLLKEREIKAPLPWEGWWSLFDYLFKNINSNTCRWSINQNNIKSAHWNILILLTPPWPGFHPLQIETYIFIPPTPQFTQKVAYLLNSTMYFGSRSTAVYTELLHSMLSA